MEWILVWATAQIACFSNWTTYNVSLWLIFLTKMICRLRDVKPTAHHIFLSASLSLLGTVCVSSFGKYFSRVGEKEYLQQCPRCNNFLSYVLVNTYSEIRHLTLQFSDCFLTQHHFLLATKSYHLQQ